MKNLLNYTLPLYISKNAGETAVLTVMNAAGKVVPAKCLILAAEVAAGGSSALIYRGLNGVTPVESRGPGFTPGGFLYDPDHIFTSAKFLIGTGGSGVVVTIEISSDEDISGSTLV